MIKILANPTADIIANQTKAIWIWRREHQPTALSQYNLCIVLPHRPLRRLFDELIPR